MRHNTPLSDRVISLPTYTNEARDDALFHYTTANGLIGIFNTEEIWSTAYYCANDESELAAGQGVLEPLFRAKTHELIQANDHRVQTFYGRGIDIRQYADAFEGQVSGMALSLLCTYITCFCKATSKEDFLHGLLSQWRGYGSDGGYALQFSRLKLLAAIDRANKAGELNYELQDVDYAPASPKKDELLRHSDAFISAYLAFLDDLAEPLNFDRERRSPIAGLTGGPLEALLDYLAHTKNEHFSEEHECRLSLIEGISPQTSQLPVEYFNRSGLLVPYTSTPRSTFNVLDCLEWIVIGPGPRMEARFKSVTQLLKQSGRNIRVRPSHIPFTRL